MLVNKPEILAPAGDLEKLYFALQYGADAVYVGGKEYSLRAGAGNFSLADLQTGLDFAHARGKKLYMAVNIFAHNRDLPALPSYLQALNAMGVDGLIISDPGIFQLAREHAPDIPLHISTQANNLNWQTARVWAAQGARRIILGRELSLAEAAEICAKGGLETELFVHGAICISYSGRCLLSSFLAERDANQGNCAHPCRWQYRLHYALEEQKRPGQYMPIEEDAHGAYILNSKDLCLLPHIQALLDSGAQAWKIEGRNKSAYYVANTARVYRTALDAAWAAREQGEDYTPAPELLAELTKISHREYTSAFALGNSPDGQEYRYADGDSLRGYDFCGVLREANGREWVIEQRNHMQIGDIIEVLQPDMADIRLCIGQILDAEGFSRQTASHPLEQIRIPCPLSAKVPAIIRRLPRKPAPL